MGTLTARPAVAIAPAHEYWSIIKFIQELSDRSGSFPDKITAVGRLVDACSMDEVIQLLFHAGVIPECLDHDSTEEKLYAKFCDYLLAASFRHLGMKASAIAERADAADVIINDGASDIVADAKAFRLSRTAKNQKDFKVEALDQWRKGAKYACLVCPLFQYPSSSSQIYSQAGRYNVTLLSYEHLVCLLEARKRGTLRDKDWDSLWNVTKAGQASKDAASYWWAVDNIVANVAGTDIHEIKGSVKAIKDKVRERAKTEAAYWAERRDALKRLTHEEAIHQLCKALKIDDKIRIIEQI